jgi:hypothetical protein
MFLGFKGIEELEKLYSKGGIRNIRDGLAPAFESKPVPLVAVECETIPKNNNLFLLPGHIGLRSQTEYALSARLNSGRR